MGNRAIITTREEYDNNTLGLYLHWNGGRDSVEAFLAYCKLRGDRSPEEDGYGYARLAQIIGNWFGGTLSVGVMSGPQDWASGCDNGAYIVKNWEIVGREEYGDWPEQDEYDLLEMMLDIDEAQPERERLGSELISAYVLELRFPITYEEKLELLEVGSKVIVNTYEGWNTYEVLGFGETGRITNGHDVSGVPFFNSTKYYERYMASFKLDENNPDDLEKIKDNINSYLVKDKRFYLPNRPEHVEYCQRSLIDLI